MEKTSDQRDQTVTAHLHLQDHTLGSYSSMEHTSETSKSSTYRKSIPELRNKTVCNCCHGWLLLSQLHQLKNNIIVYKHDFNHLFWHVVKTAKDGAFFVDANCAMSCPALDPNGGGLVYFVTQGDRSLYTFNVDEGTVSVSLPCPHLPTTPSWILPSSFRLICTTFCLAAPMKMMSHSYKFRGEPVSPTPWLAFCNKVVCTFIDPRVCHKYCITIQPQSFCDYTICHASEGRMLICSGFQIMLFHPMEKWETERLPVLPLGLDDESWRFGFCCLKPYETLVVGFSIDYTDGVSIVMYTHTQRSQWYVYKCDISSDFRLNDCGPVFYKGAFYFLGQDGNLGVFHIEIDEDEEDNEGDMVTWKVLDTPRPCYYSCDSNFLVECDGKLMTVFVGRLGKWVQVLELNESKMCWEKVESLGKHTLYLSSVSSIGVEAKYAEMENKILFPRLWEQNVLVHCVGKRRYQTIDGIDIGADYYNTRTHFGSFWIYIR